MSLKLWRKVNGKAKTSRWCLEAELKRYAKIWAILPTCLDTALSRMSWIFVSNSCTSDTRITPPSECCTEATINQCSYCIRNKMFCIQSGMNTCTNASLRIRRTLIRLLNGRIQCDILWWQRSLESKRCLMTGKTVNQFRGWNSACQSYRQQ